MVEATIVAGPPPGLAAPIASVFDSAQRGIFVLGQRGNDLVFFIRTGLRAVELGGQWVVLRSFAGHQPGDSARVSGGVVGGAWVLRSVHDGAVVETRVAMTPGLMWSALLPFVLVLGPAAPFISAVWLGVTIAPAGYFAGRGTRSVRSLVVAAFLAGGSLTGAALATGLSVPPLAEYAGTILGLALGWLVGRRVHS
jgi:hypothetical protein